MPPINRRSPPHPGPLPRWGRGGLYGARRRRVGLLGGSFNPAHGGHLHISRLALQRLDLDEIWWLVSPQNPLKPTAGMAPFEERLRYAAEIAAADRRIRVTDIEARLGPTTYTADTLKALRRRFPRTRFVWLMGGDNLAQIPILASLARHLSHRPDRRFRPARHIVKGAGRGRGASLRGRARAGHGGTAAGRDDPAGLGVFPYPPRPAIGHADTGRSFNRTYRRRKDQT